MDAHNHTVRCATFKIVHNVSWFLFLKVQRLALLAKLVKHISMLFCFSTPVLCTDAPNFIYEVTYSTEE